MKSYNQIEKQHSAAEIAESLVFPGTRELREREAILQAFRGVRKRLSEKETVKSKTISLLLQLKFMLEDYVTASSFDKHYHFGYFLKEYIVRLEKKNKDFAHDINVDPTELSLVINQRRKPTDKLIYRLEIHSNRNFPALLWFRLLEKERAFQLTHNRSIVDQEKKHVKSKLEFSF